MSLLFTPVYANPSKPIWLSATGGSITGNLTVDGTITATSDIISETEVDAPSLRVIDSNAASKMILQNDGAGNSLIQSTDVIKFTQLGTINGNTTLTQSVAGANADNLTVGGTINCLIGPVPPRIITSTKTVNPIAVSPAAPSQFGVDTTITSISGAEYDVQVTGNVFCVSGSPDPTDYIVYEFTAGGSGTVDAIVFPAAADAGLGGNGVTGLGPLVAAGAAATVNLRARVVSSASGTTLGANARVFQPSGTAVYGATLTVLDVQRVR
jgi:hypothetical protein